MEISRATASKWVNRYRQFGAVGLVGRLENCGKGVFTTYTLFASDRVVYRPDWAALLMFSGVPSIFKGWNAVRVPPRAQLIPSSEGILL